MRAFFLLSFVFISHNAICQSIDGTVKSRFVESTIATDTITDVSRLTLIDEGVVLLKKPIQDYNEIKKGVVNKVRKDASQKGGSLVVFEIREDRKDERELHYRIYRP